MEQEKKKRPSSATIRKASTRGVHTQKMMSFRVDNDIAERLTQEANKGRLINDLLRKHYNLPLQPLHP